MGNVKRKYIIRAYYADPHKKEYYKVIAGNDFILFVYKLFLRILLKAASSGAFVIEPVTEPGNYTINWTSTDGLMCSQKVIVVE